MNTPSTISQCEDDQLCFPGMAVETVAAGKPATLPFPMDIEAYADQVLNSEANRAYEADPDDWKKAKALTMAIYDALHDHATKVHSTGILLNSSTGKDSTLMVALYYENAYQRLKAGKPVLPAIVGISDTGSEFPDMQKRMFVDSKNMSKTAVEMGLPIEVKLVQPPAKSRLMVEIIGAGMALPQLKSGGSSSGFVGASWCMDRVKATPLGTILKEAKNRFPYFLQCVGVRSAESAKRAATVRKYGEDLPFGLTQLDGGRDSATRLGATPIVHWSDAQLRQWMLESFAVWDPLSNDNLRHIYALGSKPNERAGECVLTITKEGAVSNVCSDLGGARFGCWCCLLSTNKSLGNAAEQDERYAPLKAFHTYLFNHHARGDRRRELRSESGHNDMSLFPKGFTMLERIKLLMRLFRAQEESGFSLISEAELEEIEKKWNRHGLYSYTPKDALEDTRTWMEECPDEEPEPFFRRFSGLANTTLSLAEGLPLGAYYHLLNPGVRSLELAHLFPMVEFGTPLFPELTAYIFCDHMDNDRILTLISDSPSVMGGRTNTGLLNGLIGARWQLRGIRRPSPWEHEISDGRTVFYEMRMSVLNPATENIGENSDMIHPLIESFHLNLEVLKGAGCFESTYGEYITSMHDAIESTKALTPDQFKVMFRICEHMAELSDILTDEGRDARAAIMPFLKNHFELLEAKGEVGNSKQAVDFRKGVKELTRDRLELHRLIPLVEEYIEGVRLLARAARKDVHPALLNQMAYIARTKRYDPSYAATLLQELLAHLPAAEAQMVA